MIHILPLGLRILSFNVASSLALPNFWNFTSFYGQLWPTRSVPAVERDVDNINFNPDGSPFLWLLQDEYKGKTFYEYVLFFWDYLRSVDFDWSRWNFFDHPDPTKCVLANLHCVMWY